MPPHRDTSPLLIILVPIFILFILFFTVPPLLSATSHVLRPTSVVKNSWDSLNILLVLLAILFGVFAKPNNQSPLPPHHQNTNNVTCDGEGSSYVSQQWFQFSEDRNVPIRSPATGFTRFRTTSTSYPDLRSFQTSHHRYKFRSFDDFDIHRFTSTPPRDHVNAAVDHRNSSPESEEFQHDRDHYQFRFINDFQVNKFRSNPARDEVPAVVDYRKRLPEDEEFKEDGVKVIPVDTCEVHSSSTISPPQQSSPAPPAPPPPPPMEQYARRQRRTHRKVESSNEITEADKNEITRMNQAPSPSVKTRSEHKREKSKVKREIAMVWASVLSNKRKRKKKQSTKTHNVNELTRNTTVPPPPPPPTPPPQHSVFQSLFRKGLGKNKKMHSVPTPPPPPPPLTSSRRWSKLSSQIPPQPSPPLPSPPLEPFRRRNSGRPPLPNKVINYDDETINNSGNQSPMIPVPPPLPPFQMAAMKFSIRGDFVKIRSNQSSLCSSPEREDVNESEPTTTTTTSTATTVIENGEVGVPIFCNSPDVNVKAATFIAKHKGKWKLEKINSINHKHNTNAP